MTDLENLPIAVIGGGPVGLAAAAHLIERGLAVRLYEAGASVAANMRDWGHVRTFSPWRYSIDAVAAAILRRYGWVSPPADAMPTGAELYEQYLRPLAATPALAAVVETGAKVTAISRQGMDKVVSAGREARPFVLSIATAGGMRRDLARAVIDASGKLMDGTVVNGPDDLRKTPVFRGSELEPGAIITGPAIIEEPTTTIVVYPNMSATVSPSGHYILKS